MTCTSVWSLSGLAVEGAGIVVGPEVSLVALADDVISYPKSYHGLELKPM